MKNEYVGASLYGEQNKNKKHEKSLSKARNLNIMCKNICDEIKSYGKLLNLKFKLKFLEVLQVLRQV